MVASTLASPALTLTSPMESKPSSWLSSSSMVRWISRSPPLCASYRFVPIASISSARSGNSSQQAQTSPGCLIILLDPGLVCLSMQAAQKLPHDGFMFTHYPN